MPATARTRSKGYIPRSCHRPVTRLYGHECPRCKKIPGFVWRCTEDYGGVLPAWEDNREGLEVDIERILHGEADLAELELETVGGAGGEAGDDALGLKPWMEAAIRPGHYSQEEVMILRKQVKESI